MNSIGWRGFRDSAIAVFVLVALLGAMDLGPVAALSDAISQSLAMLAGPVLDAVALPVLRSGAELRSLDGSWAVIVTEVCDGYGLMAAWFALTLALLRGGEQIIRWSLIGWIAIQFFNLVRVIVLATVLARFGSSVFESVHLFVFPILTTALFAGIAALAIKDLRSRYWPAVGTGAVVAVCWFWMAAQMAAAVLVPAANTVLSLLDPWAINGLVMRDTAWVVLTDRLAVLDPPAFLSAPIYPEDYAIATPVLLAAAAVTWWRGWPVWASMALAVVLMVAGLSLGSMTVGWSVPAPGGAPGQIVEIAQDGTVTLEPDNGPGTFAAGIVRLAQNGVVYFNLLVLPILVLAAGSRQ